MGAIFRPKYPPPGQTNREARQAGTLRESAVWWIRFQQHGKTVKQCADTTDKGKAKAFLEQQTGKIALRIPVDVRAERLTLTDGAKLIRRDYQTNGRKSSATLEYRLARLLEQFGEERRLSRITTANVQEYRARRTAEGVTHATVNREVAALARIAVLARTEHGLVAPFVVKTTTERNARQGFFEAREFAAVCAQLPPHLAALARAAYLTGWRKDELRSRQWRHVDFAHGVLRLDPEETKNRKGREFPLIPELRALLEAQRGRGDEIQRETKQVVPWVFARPNGKPAGDFKKAWATACIKAGFFRVEPVLDKDGTPQMAKDGTPLTVTKPTKLVHDCRRTAARTLIRSGVSEAVAMDLLGHQTPAIFRRYAIVDSAMRQEAGAKLAAYHQGAETARLRQESPRSRQVVALKA
jgi:integrase